MPKRFHLHQLRQQRFFYAEPVCGQCTRVWRQGREGRVPRRRVVSMSTWVTMNAGNIAGLLAVRLARTKING